MRRAAVSILWALCLVPSLAQAEILRLSLGGSDAAVSDSGYDYLSENAFLSMGQLGIDVKLAQGDWGGLWIGGEYHWSVEHQTAIEGVDTTLDIDGFVGQVRYEFEPLPFMGVWAGGGGGVYNLDLSATLLGSDREQDRYTGAFLGLAGVEIFVPKGFLSRVFGGKRNTKGWTVGVSLEGGYRLALPVEFDDLREPEPEKEPDPEDRPITVDPLQLGELNLSGALLRAALVVRF